MIRNYGKGLSAWARRAVRVVAAATALALGAAAVTVPAMAHGEKSQQAFLRMRSINWYDVKWSKKEVNVNEEVEITGKFHLFSGWPDAIHVPDTAFLNVGVSGPQLVREASFLGGAEGDTFVPRSVSLQIGKDYAFRILLRARRPGSWHSHVMLSVLGGGPIVGPGEWITVKGSYDDFKNMEKTLDGREVNIEDWGMANAVTWHIVWMVLGAAWILFWFFRGGFFRRFIRTADEGDGILTPQDNTAGYVALVGVIGLTVVTASYAQSLYPRTIPLQAGTIKGITPIPEAPSKINVTVKRAQYSVPGRDLSMTLDVTNNSTVPVRVGEFTTAGLRFLNPKVYPDADKVQYPDYILSMGLSTDNNDQPIEPGQTKTVTVKVVDAIWEVQRLSDLAYDTDSQFGGLLMFFDPQGGRHKVEVGGPVVPIFR